MTEDNLKEKTGFGGHIRSFEPADLPAVREIMIVWVRDRDTGRPLPDEVETNLREMVKSLRGKSGRKYLVAEDAGQVLGVIGYKSPDTVMRSFAKTQNPAELINAYVRQDLRGGGGVGTALVRALENAAQESGFSEIILNSGPRYEKTGWGFYDKIGYERCGVAKNYYGRGGNAQVWRHQL